MNIEDTDYINLLFADNLKQDQEIRTKLNVVFQEGFRAFRNGGRKPYNKPTRQQSVTVSKRMNAINTGNNWFAERLTIALSLEGYKCFDIYDKVSGKLTRTKLEQVTQAYNPYSPNTALMHKEWQRGWDRAYFIQQSYQRKRNSNN